MYFRTFDTSILNHLTFGPGLSITPVKQEPEYQFNLHDTTYNPFENQNGLFHMHKMKNNEKDTSSTISESEDPLADPSQSILSLILNSQSKIDFPIDFSTVIKTELEAPESTTQHSDNMDKCLEEKPKKKKIVKNRQEQLNPVPEELDEPVHCDVCNITYKNNVAFGLHSDTHSEDGKFSCHLCDYKNVSKYHMEMHMRAHEGTTKYKCEICGKAFTVSTHAIEHKYFHTGEKPFQCEICGKHFMFSWFLTSHRRTQHWEIMTGSPLVKYDCTICNKHYTSSTGLKRHNYSYHNVDGVDASVLCDICGKRLSNKEKLKFHRRIHTGYKPFTCEICSKSFSRKEQLKEHERVHTGEKPYICKFCGKGFTQRSPLRIHERTHTGERPYVCMICGKGFISKGVMDTHMKSCSASVTHSILS